MKSLLRLGRDKMDITIANVIAVVVMTAGVSGSHWMNKTDIAVNETNIESITNELDRIEKKVDRIIEAP